MSKRQLAVLFVMNLSMYILANGLMPLLPVYATRLGADPVIVGYYLSFTFVTLVLGALAAGWAFGHVRQVKTLPIVCGVIMVPCVFLMGQVTNVWQLAALNGVVWFFGAMSAVLVSILASLYAGERERGTVFGILSVSLGLGALIGGLTMGPIADRSGYPTMFALTALAPACWLLAVLFLADASPPADQGQQARTGQPTAGFGPAFYLLFASAIVSAAGLIVAGLITSLAMNRQGFSATAISSTAVASGIVAMPLSFLMGWLSDRVGRKAVLVVCYLAAVLSLVALIGAVPLWQFWTVSALVGVSNRAKAIGSAFTADLVPKAALAKAMSRYNAAEWLAGPIGYTAGGYAIQYLGMTPTLIGAAFLALSSVALLAAIRRPASQG